MISDIIWDFDGTLFDTYPETVNAFRKALSDRGIKETKENIRDFFKVSEGYAATHFKNLYGLDDEFIHKYNDYKRNIEIEKMKPFPYAIDVCRQFVASGGRNYILTHRGDSTLRYLEHYKMMCYFTEVITKHYGFKRKPDPQSFEYLIEKYQMNKRTTMVVGDRECEIAGGKAVGIKTCLYDTNNVSLAITPDFYIDNLEKLVNIIK